MGSLRDLAAKLDSKSPAKLHDQLYLLLKSALEENQLDEVRNGRLPSQRKMAEILGVSRETLSKVLFRLIQEGCLSANERSGVFLNEKRQCTDLTDSERGSESSISEGVSFKQEGDNKGSPPLFVDNVPSFDYASGHHTQRFLKTLRQQSAKKTKLPFDSCGLISLRNLLCQELARSSGLNCLAEDTIVFSDLRACIDFIIRLTTKARPTCVIEAYGSLEVRALLELSGVPMAEIPVDKYGARTDILPCLQILNALYFSSPVMHDPLGIPLSSDRTDQLLSWVNSSDSILVEVSHSQEFLLNAAASRCVYVSSASSYLKPWTQICFAVLPSEFRKEAQKLKSAIGGAVSIIEQKAFEDFFSSGDLLRAEKHRELSNLKKRRDLEYSFAEIFKADVHVSSGNCGPKLVIEIISDANSLQIVRSISRCGLLIRLIEEFPYNEKFVIDLDTVSAESLERKLKKLKQVYRAGG